jgi:hypothetical protein
LRTELPPEIEDHRDDRWCRDATRSVTSVADAERFIEQVGFASALTDSRRPGPSLYLAVCGRRDAVLPRNVQKDPETSLAWTLKDQIVRRGGFTTPRWGARNRCSSPHGCCRSSTRCGAFGRGRSESS